MSIRHMKIEMLGSHYFSFFARSNLLYYPSNACSVRSSASTSMQGCAIFIQIQVNTRRIHILALRWMQKRVCCLRSVDNIQNGASLTRRDREETNC